MSSVSGRAANCSCATPIATTTRRTNDYQLTTIHLTTKGLLRWINDDLSVFCCFRWRCMFCSPASSFRRHQPPKPPVGSRRNGKVRKARKPNSRRSGRSAMRKRTTNPKPPSTSQPAEAARLARRGRSRRAGSIRHARIARSQQRLPDARYAHQRGRRRAYEPRWRVPATAISTIGTAIWATWN